MDITSPWCQCHENTDRTNISQRMYDLAVVIVYSHIHLNIKVPTTTSPLNFVPVLRRLLSHEDKMSVEEKGMEHSVFEKGILSS